MCELFGACAQAPRNFSQWLVPFRDRGGRDADNPDGWGIAHWHGGGASIEKAPDPGWQSERFLDLARNASAHLVLAHVRKARHPPLPGFLNTHPFAQDCCGHEWVFAHNGLVPAAAEWHCAASPFHPRGETDSETAFCHLLGGIAGDYDPADHARWLPRLAEVAGGIAARGKFNFLLSDGRFLIAYGHDRLQYRHDASGGAVALVATEPLSDDGWHRFDPGELRVYRDGALFARFAPPALHPPAAAD